MAIRGFDRLALVAAAIALALPASSPGIEPRHVDEAAPRRSSDDATVAASSPTTPPAPRAAPRPRATLIFDPDALRIGDIVEIQVAVVSPPGWRLRPLAWPSVEGIEIAGEPELGLERGDERWIHRWTIRARPKRLGKFEWPSFVAMLEGPEERVETVPIEGRTFDVDSISSAFPTRDAPFGLQRPASSITAARSAGGDDGRLPAVAMALVGSLALVAGIGIGLGIAAHRRASAAGSRDPEAASDPGARDLAPDAWALAELQMLRASWASDPRRSASVTASTLRAFIDRRYGTDIQGATTDELERGAPLWFLESRWSELTTILRELDDARFPRSNTLAPESTLDRAISFIRDSQQPGSRRRAATTPDGDDPNA